MRETELEIHRHRWRVKIFFAVTRYDINTIMRALYEINCPEDIAQRVYKNLRHQKMDTGFTYSNIRERATVMVVGLASSPAEFLNSFEHELRHLVDDVAKAIDIDLTGENVAYLTGDINLRLWGDIHDFICCCNDKRKDRPTPR